MAKPVAGIFCR